MSFNPSPLKKPTEICFSKKSNVIDHPDLVFNKNTFHKALSPKHLRLILDDKHNFKEHVNRKLSKAQKGIGILNQLHHFTSRSLLLTIYATFHLFTLILILVILSTISLAMFLSLTRLTQFNIASCNGNYTWVINGKSRVKLFSGIRTWKANLQNMGVLSLSLQITD